MPTITVHPFEILESESSFQSVDSSYPFSNAIGKGTDSTTYAQWYMVTGGAALTRVFYAFDLSEIPENATITSVICKAKCQCENSSSFRGGNNGIYLYCGSTQKTKTDGVQAFGTTESVVEVPETTWTRDELNSLKLLIFGSRGYLSTNTSYWMRLYGADLTVTYEIPSSPILYVKNNGIFVACANVYKKIDNVWVEQTDLNSVFDENSNYMRGDG